MTQIDLVRTACKTARAVIHHIPRAETRPLAAIEAAELWANVPTEENKALCNTRSREAFTAYTVAYYAVNDTFAVAAYAAYAAAYAASAPDVDFDIAVAIVTAAIEQFPGF